MRVLFIPCGGTPLPHLIPLLALAECLDARRHQVSFLVPRAFRGPVGSLGYRVLNIDYSEGNWVRAEMAAYEDFLPDVVVDDLSFTVLLSSTLDKTPRVALRRTGSFPGGRNHPHSARNVELFMPMYRNFSDLCGMKPPRNIADLCSAPINVIPGIATIEPLPSPLVTEERFEYAGLLTLSDAACEQLSVALQRPTTDPSAIDRFLDANANRLIVLMTLGTVLEASPRLREVVEHVLAEGAAIVSTVDTPPLTAALRERFLFAPFLPLDRVASRAHFMIHHCGSGTYQYQVRHRLPAICIGSGYYDRDEVAMRLEKLQVAHYVPPGTSDIVAECCAAFDVGADVNGSWHSRARATLDGLAAEVDRTAASFDFERVLEVAAE